MSIWMKPLAVAALLFGSLVLLAASPKVKVMTIPATEDAYVITDASKADDPQGLRDRNFGAQDGLLVSYSNKAQQDEQLITVGLVKFDLSALKGKQLQAVVLQLGAVRADLAQAPRLVDVSLVSGQWSESNVTFSKRPTWTANPIATTAVYGPGVWYSWDVSGSIPQSIGQGQVGYALGFRSLDEKKAEQVIFAAHETGQSGPRLIVTYLGNGSGVAWWVWAAGGGGGAALVAIVAGAWLIRHWRRPVPQQTEATEPPQN